MIFLGMIFTKGNNKVAISYYLYRFITDDNRASFFLQREESNYSGGFELSAELFYIALRNNNSFREWFESA